MHCTGYIMSHVEIRQETSETNNFQKWGCFERFVKITYQVSRSMPKQSIILIEWTNISRGTDVKSDEILNRLNKVCS